ncbi:hypothetical protein GOARA_050_00530 [Gordonia araii NBRC 100433]|uniref:Integral membrane protein n=1 Tax=Gordonia araii NBRC 100433 TaxID=1073574 RepID=G7H2B6_9ACTN|nr:hypothetical protein [Gordonia araii]NNG97530.1 hypothetical protein [Gordonia araii NBRC 100433]GAB09991.1 hypothetical protein GOARA_050_00530 [Gordonia araii NBRC 100433]
MSVLDNLTGTERLPLTLLFVAFLATFVITRAITRLIRAGKGPFRNNVRGGVHIHHSIPGIVLTIAGAITSVAANGTAPAAAISAVMIGVGSSLVLDEFALLLHLQDVYWSREGQLSVQVVMLTGAVLGLLALGVDPFTENGMHIGHIVLLANLPIHLLSVVTCVNKGKFSTAVFGAFLPPIAWAGALRLARPGSRWADKRYSPDELTRAKQRADGFDARWGRRGLAIGDLVAGRPSDTTASTRES